MGNDRPATRAGRQYSITDGGGGTTIITPIQSDANFTLYQVGVAFGLR